MFGGGAFGMIQYDAWYTPIRLRNKKDNEWE